MTRTAMTGEAFFAPNRRCPLPPRVIRVGMLGAVVDGSRHRVSERIPALWMLSDGVVPRGAGGEGRACPATAIPPPKGGRSPIAGPHERE